MATPRFVHLHCHTHYSLLDGANKIPDLVKRTKALGMDSLAITDHGCMFGVVEFFNECKKEGIKPILGMEAYIAPNDRRERSTSSGNASDAAYHLLLLCQNLEGYRNLTRLSSIAYREGFYYKPRIDFETLRQYSGGLIGTSACLGGQIPSALLKHDAKNAKKLGETYLDIFGPERFFIEVQRQGLTEQEAVNPELVELSKKLGVGLVATNDVHFLQKEDHFAHDVLCCISMGRLVSDANRIKYPEHLYLKSPQEMQEALGEYDQAIENTGRIADLCNVELDFTKRYAPVYRVPKEELQPAAKNAQKNAEPMNDDERYLRQLCEAGLDWRYETRDVSQDIRKRLDYELTTITSKNFCSYFLIVWDVCNFARKHGIPVGARGSGVGTMAGYLLGLCDVDPIKYGLLFERFMDPSRNEMPDIDLDICQEGRGKVIEYVREKYGHVAQIITFGTLAARAVCKDVGRVMGVPLTLTDKITKLIAGVPGMTLEKALKASSDLQSLYDSDPQVRQIIDIGKRLEGLCRNAGTHAAGVVVADQPLENFVPLCKFSDDLLTQFEGTIVEKVGLLKIDFLGLRTLTTLQRALDLVKKVRNVEIDIEKIDLADKKVLELFARGKTKGIFQFESGGMQDLLMRMRPDRLEDLIAANALYRPGPMELIPSYCNRKHGKEATPSVHPIIDRILAETYGIMVYQEQVMQIFNQLGGIDLSAAYKLIKAISKKNSEVIEKYRPDFLKGAQANGVTKAKAQEIFELILKFGGYGFNKSHSTRYAIVAFQTAFMKTYYPVEYMAALLTFESGSTDKVVEYIDDCRRITLPDGQHGIKVLAPDINESHKDFTPVYETGKPGVIRFGLMAVRGIGEKAAQSIFDERARSGPFSGLYDFCQRIDQRQVSRAAIEAFIKCGAFASTKARRAQLLAILDRAVELGQQSQDDRRSGQLSMFATAPATITTAAVPDSLPDVPELSDPELLKFEKDLLGFYITSHPLAEHQPSLTAYATATTREAKNLPEERDVTVGGMITRLKKTMTKAGKPMAIVTIEDLDGQIDATLFPRTYEEIMQKFPAALALEQIVFIRGKIDKKRETPSLLADELYGVKDAIPRLTKAVTIEVDASASRDLIKQLKPILTKHKGEVPSRLQVPAAGSRRVLIGLDRSWFVRPTAALKEDLESTLNGHGRIELAGDGTLRARRLQQQQMFQAAETAPAEDPIPVPIAPDEMMD